MIIRRAYTVLVKEFQELFRDKKARTIVFISPIVQLIIFGYAATYDIRNIPTAVLDQDYSTVSRRVIRSLEASGYFQVERYLTSEAQIDTLLQHGDVWLVLQIPRGLAEELKSGRPAQIAAALDAVNSNSAMIASSYLGALISRLNEELRTEAVAALPAELRPKFPPVENRVRVWYNPDLESRNFNVPAIVVQILVVVTLMLTSMAIVRDKEFGTMEQLIVTPIRPVELIIGKALPYAFIGMVDIAIICAVAVFYFKVPLLGSLALLFTTSLMFMISTLAIGLFISTISQSQQQAMISAFFFMMPAILLSGFAFPIDNMPTAIQYLTYLNPLRYFVVIIRSIFLKGVTIDLLWNQILPLLGLGLGALALAAARFRKRTA